MNDDRGFTGWLLRLLSRFLGWMRVQWADARPELETKVEERTHELTRLYQQCLAANRLKSEFVATMSHQLRTPLNVILGYTEMLLEQDVVPGREQDPVMLRHIHDASESVLHLVDNLLDLRKLETGKMPVQSERVSLAPFLDGFRRHERVPRAAGVRLLWRVDSNLPDVETDAAKLAIVLDNLVNNALKFTTAGAVTVTAVDLPAQEQVRFRVEDTGPGIPADQLDAIFEPFHQVEGRRNDRPDGAGLGLAIVRRYVALLSGTIVVRSEPGSGTAFEVTLPYRPGGGRPATAPTPIRPRPARHLRLVPAPTARVRAAGFTSAEILVGGALALTVLAAIQSFGRTQLGQLASQSVYAESQSVTRGVIDLMSRELRMATYQRPQGSCGFNSGITEATPTRIHFQQDLNGDGVVTGPGEDVVYQLSESNLLRTDGNGGATVLVSGVSSNGFSLRYFDGSNPAVELVPAGSPPALTAAQRDCVAKVRITVSARLQSPNPASARPLVSVAESEIAIRNRSLNNF